MRLCACVCIVKQMLGASLDFVHHNEMGHNLYGMQLADLLWIVNYQDLARQQARWMDRLQIARLDVREGRNIPSEATMTWIRQQSALAAIGEL